MLGKQSGQIDAFNEMIFQRLIPKEQLLVKIDSIEMLEENPLIL